jgi:hypothetical protein
MGKYEDRNYHNLHDPSLGSHVLQQRGEVRLQKQFVSREYWWI